MGVSWILKQMIEANIEKQHARFETRQMKARLDALSNQKSQMRDLYGNPDGDLLFYVLLHDTDLETKDDES